MGTRRKSREAALQFLYQNDFVAVADVGDEGALLDSYGLFCSLYQVNRKARPYGYDLIKGVLSELESIDSIIEKCATHWRLPRLAPTDRNLLRIAVYEMLHVGDVPPEVAINEAVEVAKRFGGDESPRFINGVLDAVRAHLQ
ncbi:N utilization substance protein B [Desulfomarina profundi]|uniref:Transcription antitermination protein NusB n=1 Tax=Desulfomarina profundi TaxID=2772557 RepID=A0A8D5FQ52_9BACT|nr:transcription antitermination factor NusB [Desulfomarina profundi]BCL59754.1 N utilization substance protein B [Desulfomarina profundi]